MDEMSYTDDMREISGFGGGYEAACRRMVLVGARWLRDNVTDEEWKALLAEAETDRTAWSRSPVREQLDRVVGESEPGSSGAMHGAAMSHAQFIRTNGWDAYAAKMREQKKEEVGNGAR